MSKNLWPVTPEANAEFGLSVAINHPWLMVGAPENANGLEDAVEVLIFIKLNPMAQLIFSKNFFPECTDQQANALFGPVSGD